MPDGFEKLEAALKEKVQNRLVPDTETTVSIERGRPSLPDVAHAAGNCAGEVNAITAGAY